MRQPGGHLSLRASVPAFLVLGVLVLVATPLAPATTPNIDSPVLGQTLVEGHVTHAILGVAPLTGGPITVQPTGTPLPSDLGPRLGVEARTARPMARIDQATCWMIGQSCPYEGPSVREVFPGLRWPNDQFVVDPVNNTRGPAPYAVERTQFVTGLALLVGEPTGDGSYQYPCSGTVLVVPHGDADPRPIFANDASATQYVESYYVTDPNDAAWDNDMWSHADANGATHHVWTVPMGQATINSPCAPVMTDSTVARSMGRNGDAYPGRDQVPPSGFQYNAFVLIPSEYLPVTGVVEHGLDGERTTDAALDGNSHAFDPYGKLLRSSEPNHGGSGPTGASGEHATYSVDAYFLPTIIQENGANFRLVDLEGSDAPFG